MNMCMRACLHLPELGCRKSEYRLCIRETYERAHSLHLWKVKKKKEMDGADDTLKGSLRLLSSK